MWQTLLVYLFFISLTLILGKIVSNLVYEMPVTDMAQPDKPITYPDFSEKKARAHLVHLAKTIGKRLTSTKALEIDAVNYITSQIQLDKDDACPVNPSPLQSRYCEKLIPLPI